MTWFGHAILMSPSRSSCLLHQLLFWKPPKTRRWGRQRMWRKDATIRELKDTNLVPGVFPPGTKLQRSLRSRTLRPKEKQKEGTVFPPEEGGRVRLHVGFLNMESYRQTLIGGHCLVFFDDDWRWWQWCLEEPMTTSKQHHVFTGRTIFKIVPVRVICSKPTVSELSII